MPDDITHDGITQIAIFHTFEMFEPRLPGPGDRALCGYVKQTDALPQWPGQPCVVCMDLERYREWAVSDAEDDEGTLWND